MSRSTTAYLPRVPSLPTEDPKLASIRADVAQRIAGVCADLSPRDFAGLVDQIARFKRRWELREPPDADGAPAGMAGIG